MFPNDSQRTIEEMLNTFNGAYKSEENNNAAPVPKQNDSSIKNTVESLLFSDNNNDNVKYNQTPVFHNYKTEPVYLVAPTSNQKTFDCAYCCSKDTVYADINDNPIIKRINGYSLALYFKKCKYCKLMNMAVTAVEEYLLGSKTMFRQTSIDSFYLHKISNFFQQDLYNRLFTIYSRTEHLSNSFSKIISLGGSNHERNNELKRDIFQMDLAHANGTTRVHRTTPRARKERAYHGDLKPKARDFVARSPLNNNFRTVPSEKWDLSVFKKDLYQNYKLKKYELKADFSDQTKPAAPGGTPTEKKDKLPIKPFPENTITNDIMLLKEISDSIEMNGKSQKNHLHSLVYRQLRSDPGRHMIGENIFNKHRDDNMCSGVVSNSYVSMKRHCYKALPWFMDEVGLVNNNFNFNCVFCGKIEVYKNENLVELNEKDNERISLFKTDLKPYDEDKLKVNTVVNTHLPNKYNHETGVIWYKLENLNLDQKRGILKKLVTCNTELDDLLANYLLYLSNSNIKNILEKYYVLSPANDIRRFLAFYNNEEKSIEVEQENSKLMQEKEEDLNEIFARDHI
eukprot:GAHX01001562.1.p1 GENE.GAHX01001562.1~~GAHX01001562.1.p1  ORF type:complete len:578 (+),score=120.73 GAHX01001562.1:31-1734(+)